MEPVKIHRNLVKVFIVDAHPLVRCAVRALVEPEPGLAWAGEAGDAADAIAKLAETAADVVVVELTLPGGSGNGLELIRDLRWQCPHARVVVLTSADGSAYAERCLQAGASGFVSKSQEPRAVVNAVRRVADGGVYLDESLSARLLARHVTGQAHPVERLSEMEFEVFQLIAEGLATPTIASRMHRSIKTVETYRHRIKGKLGLSNATELAQYSLRYFLEASAAGDARRGGDLSSARGESPAAKTALRVAAN